MDGVKAIRFKVDQANADRYHAAVSARLRGFVVSEDLQEAFYELGLNSQALIDHVATLPHDSIIVAGHYFQSLVPSAINAHPGRIFAIPAFHDEPEFYWRPIARMVNNARKILFLSEEEKDLAIRAYGPTGGRKVIEAPVVGLGVDLSRDISAVLKDKSALTRTLSRFDLPNMYLVYVGRIEGGKGLSYLMPWIDSFNARRTANGKFPIPLLLIGSGPPDVVPSSPFLRVLGYLAEEDKVAVMSGAIALVNPSMLESFSYVVMEAWLAGIAVLVPTSCAVTSGHVYRCNGGIVFENEKAFCDGIEALLDRDTRSEMASRGRRYVQANFRWPDVTDRILRAILQ